MTPVWDTNVTMGFGAYLGTPILGVGPRPRIRGLGVWGPGPLTVAPTRNHETTSPRDLGSLGLAVRSIEA